VKSERGHTSRGGSLKGKVDNTIEAEMMAIANGIFIALSSGILLNGDTVLVQTDSQSAIERYDGRVPGTGRCVELRFTIEQWCEQHSIRLRFRHVKGHLEAAKAKSRHHVNNTCDLLARKGMQKARSKHLKSLQNR
jgi:ribonuclease HI